MNSFRTIALCDAVEIHSNWLLNNEKGYLYVKCIVIIEKKNKKLGAGVGGVRVEHGSLNFICFTDKSLDL